MSTHLNLICTDCNSMFVNSNRVIVFRNHENTSLSLSVVSYCKNVPCVIASCWIFLCTCIKMWQMDKGEGEVRLREAGNYPNCIRARRGVTLDKASSFNLWSSALVWAEISDSVPRICWSQVLPWPWGQLSNCCPVLLSCVSKNNCLGWETFSK